MIEREDDCAVVRGAEARFYASPWSTHATGANDAVHVGVYIRGASVSAVLTREEALAVAEVFRRVAEAS
jgi:hypothetical protein